MGQDVRFNNFVFGIALALMLGYLLFIGRPILVPVVTAILLVYVIVGVSRLSGYIPFVGKRIPPQVRYILGALVIAILTIELFTLFVANLTTIVARAPEFQESLLGTLQQGAALIGIESTLTWETVRRETGFCTCEIGLAVKGRWCWRGGLSRTKSLAGCRRPIFLCCHRTTRACHRWCWRR